MLRSYVLVFSIFKSSLSVSEENKVKNQGNRVIKQTYEWLNHHRLRNLPCRKSHRHRLPRLALELRAFLRLLQYSHHDVYRPNLIIEWSVLLRDTISQIWLGYMLSKTESSPRVMDLNQLWRLQSSLTTGIFGTSTLSLFGKLIWDRSHEL